ncbi:MAG: hypothetical protein IKH18_01230 [Clostridia bacterium]|nr:hypothetical protein [Clostridia bacterium]
MKQLTCEVCGSNELMKQDGIFVCQVCGCKYSLDDVRKMMVEGTVEVQGTVQIANAAQVSNLLKMAHSAFDSKNPTKAEEFCDQVIAMDDKNVEAWLLKGQAIHFQLTMENCRILEAYNCIMAAYRALNPNLEEEEKNKKTEEIIKALKECLEVNLSFWINNFEAGRPTDAALLKIQKTYNESIEWIKSAYKEFGQDPKEYIEHFANLFCIMCNQTSVSAWKTTVAYNYFRKDLSNYGANWNRNRNRKEYISSDVFRPAHPIFQTFLDESANLVNLLQFCEKQFNESTPTNTKVIIYENMIEYTKVPIEQVSYKGMISTTTNGYGAVMSRSEYYDIDYFLTDGAKESRRKEIAGYEAKKQAAIEEGKRKAEKRKEEYWKAHAEEKEKLTTEKASLKQQVQALLDEESRIESKDEIVLLKKQIDSRSAQKKSLGIFAGKERKVLQDQIDKLTGQLNDKIEKEKSAIKGKMAPLTKRIEEIDNEFSKER